MGRAPAAAPGHACLVQEPMGAPIPGAQCVETGNPPALGESAALRHSRGIPGASLAWQKEGRRT